MAAPSLSRVGASPLWDDVHALAALAALPVSPSNRTRTRKPLSDHRRAASACQ